MHDTYDPQRTGNRIATKHQARGFMVGPVGFMMTNRFTGLLHDPDAKRSAERQSTSSEGSWFPRGGSWWRQSCRPRWPGAALN